MRRTRCRICGKFAMIDGRSVSCNACKRKYPDIQKRCRLNKTPEAKAKENIQKAAHMDKKKAEMVSLGAGYPCISMYQIDRARNRYGATLEWWQRTMAAQDGKCAICECKFRNTKEIHVDHCHTTGEVRGLLCMSCNVGIGMLSDNIAKLEAAIGYLTKHGNQTIPNTA